MTLLKEAQNHLLESAPSHFTLDKPPLLGWWKAKFDLSLAAVAFIDYYQSILGARTTRSGQAYWQADFTANWQAAAGITEKQWDGVKRNLGTSGANFVTFKIGAHAGGKATLIRPSDQFLAVFGMTLNTFDLVVGLDERIGWRLTKAKGRDAARAAARPISDEELGALALWANRGGLARLRNAECLSEILGENRASCSAA